MIKNLSKVQTKDIIKIVKHQLLEQDFFIAFPELKTQVSVIIIGSIAYGSHDNKSDLDIAVIFSSNTLKKYKDKLKQYKSEFKKRDRQIQLFYNTTFEQLEALTEWEDDLKLREYSNAIILSDPSGKYKKIQRSIAYYPAKVFKEKVQWLFAEAVFELADRYNTAKERNDIYYASISKNKFLQLLMTAELLLNRQYPIYTKHLFRLQGKMNVVPKEYLNVLKQAVVEQDLDKAYRKMVKLKAIVERQLVAKKLIPKKDDHYWIDLRPRYQVKLD